MGIVAGTAATNYNGGDRDAFLFRVDSMGILANGTCIGSDDNDWGYGMAFSNTGDIYVCGETAGANNLATSGSHQDVFSGTRDGFLVKVQNINCPSPNGIISNKDPYCTDSTYRFYSRYIPGDKYTWTTVGGTILSGQGTDTVTIRWDSVGRGKVSMVQTNPFGCSAANSIPIVGNDNIKAYFIHFHACLGQPITFSYPGPLSNLNSTWNFGDAGSFNNIEYYHYTWHHTYPNVGVYLVTFTLDDKGPSTSGCSAYQGQLIHINALPGTSWSLKYLHGRTVQFVPADTSGKTYKWYFGDGDSSVIDSPVHTYLKDTVYKVRLIVANAEDCDTVSDSTINIVLSGLQLLTKEDCNLNILPNPFSVSTTISYSLGETEFVNAGIYDLLGRQVATLVNSSQGKGRHSVDFNPSQYGAGSAGLYILKMKIGESVIEEKLVKMK